MSNESAHTRSVAAFENENLHREIVVYRRTLNLQSQYLSNIVLGRHCRLVPHIFPQLQVHEKLSVGLHIDEILRDDVVRTSTEILIRKRLHFKSEVEVAQVLEGNRRHANLVLLGRYLDDRSVLIRLVEVLDALYMGYLALSCDRYTQRNQVL